MLALASMSAPNLLRTPTRLRSYKSKDKPDNIEPNIPASGEIVDYKSLKCSESPLMVGLLANLNATLQTGMQRLRLTLQNGARGAAFTLARRPFSGSSGTFAGLSGPSRAILAPAPRPGLQDRMRRPGAQAGSRFFNAPPPMRCVGWVPTGRPRAP